jgi:hypothetical protein
MCDSCIRRIRFPTVFRQRSHFTSMPTWIDSRAQAYILARRYHLGYASVAFGNQVVWTWTRDQFGQEQVPPYLCAMEVFEYFPTNRAYYDPIFTVQRSSPTWYGAIRDFLTPDDQIWEALYQSYQIMNNDMHTLAYLRHQQPSAARGFLARLNENLYRQIMGAMIKLTTTYVAPASGLQTMSAISQSSQVLAPYFGMNLSTADVIISASAEQGGTFRGTGSR